MSRACFVPRSGTFRTILTIGLVASLAMPAMGRRELPERVDLGRDSDGDACVAARRWTVGNDGVRNASDQPFAITCRGSASSRGYVEPQAKPIAEHAPQPVCGEPRRFDVVGLGPVDARQCHDRRLGIDTVDLVAGGYHAAGAPGVLSPLVAAMRAIMLGTPSEQTATDNAASPIDVAALPEAPAGSAASDVLVGSGNDGDADAALHDGITLIYTGRNVEASRLLNDAVAQFVSAPPMQRAELRLNAALADSNISKWDAADQHFAEAEQLGQQMPTSDAKSYFQTEVTTYRALDYLNRGRWKDVIAQLNGHGPAVNLTLHDPATLAAMNASGGASFMVGVDKQSLTVQVLAIRQASARSLAYLRLGDVASAQQTLNSAVSQTRSLQEELVERSISTAGITWLRASLEQQQARIRQREGRIDAALAGYDCTIMTMRGGGTPANSGCLFGGIIQSGAQTALSGPVVAEIQLERTTALARKPGVDRATVLGAYNGAIDMLADDPSALGTTSPLLASYLDLLVADNTAAPTPEVQERFFRAIQTVRSPGIAREYATLQAVVSGGKTGSLIRDRQDADRRYTQLTFRLSALSPGDPQIADLEEQRRQAVADKEHATAALASIPGYSAVHDAPVTIADLRAALRPGEVYFKLIEVGANAYGAVIGADGATIYAVKTSAPEVEALSQRVLTSARSFHAADGSTRIKPFEVDQAHLLFKTIAGPAASVLTSASAIVIDMSGALGGLPVSILVTQSTGPRATSSDYSHVAFLGAQAQTAIALTPTSFLQVRTKLAPSGAPKPLIGFGENAPAPAPASPEIAQRTIALSLACKIRYDDWAEMFNGNRPISATEIHVAADELGTPGAPIVTGANFTDSAILKEGTDGELAQYQVIHFATHGIPSEPLPNGLCDTPLPPSLITSLVPPDANGQTLSNGLLSFVDVARMKLDANLVVLSACETASGVSTVQGRLAGQEESAPTLDGLVRAFIVAQARAVLATYWRVPAAAGTRDLIAAFYKAGRTMPMSAALREAQVSVMARPATSHPYFWASFFLVGDGAKMMLSPPAPIQRTAMAAPAAAATLIR